MRSTAGLLLSIAAVALIPGLAQPALPQAPAPGVIPSPFQLIPVNPPPLSPGAVTLVELESRFQQEVLAGGGKAFAGWFAEDAVILNNGQPAVLGRAAIALTATWAPGEYTLTWAVEGAQMGTSSTMGFTWGRYEAVSRNPKGAAVTTSGRYITVWKKQPNGDWKVALDASADEPPNAAECCTLPKP